MVVGGLVSLGSPHAAFALPGILVFFLIGNIAFKVGAQHTRPPTVGDTKAALQSETRSAMGVGRERTLTSSSSSDTPPSD